MNVKRLFYGKLLLNLFIELKAISSRLAEVQTGMASMLGKIDESNPTILRRLMNIEDKVDRILEKGQE